MAASSAQEPEVSVTSPEPGDDALTTECAKTSPSPYSIFISLVSSSPPTAISSRIATTSRRGNSSDENMDGNSPISAAGNIVFILMSVGMAVLWAALTWGDYPFFGRLFRERSIGSDAREWRFRDFFLGSFWTDFKDWWFRTDRTTVAAIFLFRLQLVCQIKSSYCFKLFMHLHACPCTRESLFLQPKPCVTPMLHFIQRKFWQSFWPWSLFTIHFRNYSVGHGSDRIYALQT